MQIQYNITRIEEWCKSHNMPEGTLQLEHLMQATKLLQLKKVRVDLEPCLRYLSGSSGNGGRHRNHLRCVLDAQSLPNSKNVHELFRRRLRGKNATRAVCPTTHLIFYRIRFPLKFYE